MLGLGGRDFSNPNKFSNAIAISDQSYGKWKHQTHFVNTWQERISENAKFGSTRLIHEI